MKYFDCHIKKLTDPQQIASAQRLISSVYCNELNWHPKPGNPSNLTIENDRLIDDYDRDSLSIWYGAFDREKDNTSIVAAGRVLHPDINGLLELARYDIPSGLKQALKKNSRIVEINRSAVKKEYRQSNIWASLLHAGFKYGFQQGFDIMASTAIKKVQAMHQAIGFPSTSYTVSYDNSDKIKSQVYWAKYEDLEGVIKKLEEITLNKLP